MNGGRIVAEVLKKQGVKFVFTLCGGHISPILVDSKALGIQIIDVRHEVNAVFAADAVSRLSGVPGVAAVTAGPGVTNTITAIKNAQLAQSPLVLLGGGAATILKGRGSLQDIDQQSLFQSCVKWHYAVQKVKDIPWALNRAFKKAQEGVPGPVFVELPIDLLYGEELVREWYGAKGDEGKKQSVKESLTQWYINRHVNNLFKGTDDIKIPQPEEFSYTSHSSGDVRKALSAINESSRPVMLIGSQALLDPKKVDKMVQAIEKMGVPVYLSGMARGLLGKDHPLQLRHKRRNAFKEADTIVLFGVPCDFRLDYGRIIPGKSTFISVNRSKEDLTKNRKPDIAVEGDPADVIIALGEQFKDSTSNWDYWKERLRDRDQERNKDIDRQGQEDIKAINPIYLNQQIEKVMDENSIIIADGGDFVGTAAYVLQPRSPLSWLDPGVFGTLGVGAGFALGAKLVKPDAEVWIIWGDGSAAYSIAEYDTFSRHGLPVIGVIGNDAGWAQIARDQIEILKDDVGTVLQHNDYDLVAKGYGGDGKRLERTEDIAAVLQEAKQSVKSGKAYLVNAVIGKTEFRKGSISM